MMRRQGTAGAFSAATWRGFKGGTRQVAALNGGGGGAVGYGTTTGVVFIWLIM